MAIGAQCAAGGNVYNAKRREKNKVGVMGHLQLFFGGCPGEGRKSDPINDALHAAVLRYAYRMNLSSG